MRRPARTGSAVAARSVLPPSGRSLVTTTAWGWPENENVQLPSLENSKDCRVSNIGSAAASSLLTAANTSLICRPERPSDTPHKSRRERNAAGAAGEPGPPLGDTPFGTSSDRGPLSLPLWALFCCSPFHLRTETSGDKTTRDQSVGETRPRPLWGKRHDKLMRCSPSLSPIASHACTQEVCGAAACLGPPVSSQGACFWFHVQVGVSLVR